jgi:ABC-type multidrug transport system permease subunit
MLSNFLPLVDWMNGVLQAVIMFAAFAALFIALVIFMRKKK